MTTPSRAEGDERSRVAFHEAGHAVVGVLRRIAIVELTIEPNDDSLGHVRCRPYPPAVLKAIEQDELPVSTALRLCEFLAAGRAAEERWGGRMRAEITFGVGGSGDDYGKAREIAVRATTHAAEVDALVALAVQRSITLVGFNWNAIAEVARLALRDSSVGAREIRRIVAAADPSFDEEL